MPGANNPFRNIFRHLSRDSCSWEGPREGKLGWKGETGGEKTGDRVLRGETGSWEERLGVKRLGLECGEERQGAERRDLDQEG